MIYKLLRYTRWLNLKIIRKWIGGTWYRQEMTGELPGCYGGWWTKHPHPPPQILQNYQNRDMAQITKITLKFTI